MKNLKKLIGLTLAFILLLSSGSMIYAEEGNQPWVPKEFYKVRIFLSPDVNAEDVNIVRYDPDSDNKEAKVNDGDMVRLGALVRDENYGHSGYDYYVDGVEMKFTGFYMPNANVRIDVVRSSHEDKNYIVATDDTYKPEKWKTITINAGDGSFEFGGKNRVKSNTVKVYVNPLYEVELIKPGVISDYFRGCLFDAPKHKKLVNGVKGKFEADETINLTYEDVPKAKLRLHKKDGQTIEEITDIPADTPYKDILSKVREKESNLTAGEKFVCWSKNEEDINAAFEDGQKAKIIEDAVIYPEAYGNIVKYNENIAYGYRGFKSVVDLYEVVTSSENPLVYCARNGYDDSYIVNKVYVANSDAGTKLTFKDIASANIYDKEHLYEVVITNTKLLKTIPLNYTVTKDIVVLDKRRENNEDLDIGLNKNPSIYIKGEPKVDYLRYNEARLDLSNLVVGLVDESGKEKYIPFEKFEDYGITTSPSHGQLLDYRFNLMHIRVMHDKIMHDKSFTFTEQYLRVVNENEIFVPLFDEKTASPGAMVSYKPTFWADSSKVRRVPELEASPKNYYIVDTNTGKEIFINPSNEVSSILGYYDYQVKNEDAGKTLILPMKIIYRDKSIDQTNIILHVRKGSRQEVSAEPSVQDIVEFSTNISGSGIPGATIQILKWNELLGTVTVDDSGTWTLSGISENKLRLDDNISIIQNEEGKAASYIKKLVLKDEQRKDNERYPVVMPKLTIVQNINKLTDIEKYSIKSAIKDANPKIENVSILEDGSICLIYLDGSNNTLDLRSVIEPSDVSAKTDAEKNPVVLPKVKIEVADLTALGLGEKELIEAAVRKENPNAKEIVVTDDGKVKLTYDDGTINTINLNQIVDTKSDSKTDAEKYPAVAPANKVEVLDISSLTQEEKIAIVEAIKLANPNAVEVDVADNGVVTIKYNDGTTNTIEIDKVVRKKTSGETYKEQVILNIAIPSAGFNSLSISSLQPDVRIKVKVAGEEKLTTKELYTSPVGKLVISLEEPLKSGQKVEIIGSKAGLLDGGASVITP